MQMFEKTTSKNEDGTQESIERLPIGTDLLGIDGKGYEHHFSQARWTVFVRCESEIVFEQDIGRGRLSRWVDHIETKRGWQTLNYSSGQALSGDTDHVSAAMEARQ